MRRDEIRLPRFEVFQGRRGGFYWRLCAINGKVVAVGGERYATRSSAVRACRRLLRMILDVPEQVAAA